MPRILVLIMASVLASGLAGCARTKVVAEPTPTAILLAPEECVALEHDLINIGRGPRMTPSPPEEFVSLAEAEQNTPFHILLPAYLPEDATLQCVRLLGGNAVYLIYRDGLTLRQVAARSAPRWPLKDMAKDGWVEVRVAGVQGMGHEPGDVQVIGGPLHQNGVITWWLEGTTYVVTCDLPLEELVRIAKSME